MLAQARKDLTAIDLCFSALGFRAYLSHERLSLHCLLLLRAFMCARGVLVVFVCSCCAAVAAALVANFTNCAGAL